MVDKSPSEELIGDLYPQRHGILVSGPGVDNVNPPIAPSFCYPGAEYLEQNFDATDPEGMQSQIWDRFPQPMIPQQVSYPMPAPGSFLQFQLGDNQQNYTDYPLRDPAQAQDPESVLLPQTTEGPYNVKLPVLSAFDQSRGFQQFNFTDYLNLDDNPIPKPEGEPIPDNPAPRIVAPSLKTTTVHKVAKREQRKKREAEKIAPVINASLAPEDSGNLVCPFSDCKRHTSPFSRRHNLIQHKRNVHKLDIPKKKYRFGEPNPNDNRMTQRNGRRVAAAKAAKAGE